MVSFLSSCSAERGEGDVGIEVTESPTSNPTYSVEANVPSSENTAEPTQVPAKSDTSSANLTPSPTVSSLVSFSRDSASQTLPSNLMDQITFYQGHGGGGAGWEWDPCENAPKDTPTFQDEVQEQTCLYCYYYLTSCGWRANENIIVTVQLADGKSYKADAKADKYGYLTYYLSPSADDIPGWYSIAFKGDSGKLKVKFEKIAPEETGIFLDRDQLILFNFEPLKGLRLYLYEDNSDGFHARLKYVGWQDYQVGSDGNLRIAINLAPVTNFTYLIVTDDSETYSIFPPETFACMNRVSHLSPNSLAKVNHDEGAPFSMSLDQYMGNLEPPDTLIKKDEVVQVISGPHCYENGIFWTVELSARGIGWVPEVILDQYYLEPANN
jgi:hypothetical protein